MIMLLVCAQTLQSILSALLSHSLLQPVLGYVRMEGHSMQEHVHVTVQMATLELPVEVSAPQHAWGAGHAALLFVRCLSKVLPLLLFSIKTFSYQSELLLCRCCNWLHLVTQCIASCHLYSPKSFASLHHACKN